MKVTLKSLFFLNFFFYLFFSVLFYCLRFRFLFSVYLLIQFSQGRGFVKQTLNKIKHAVSVSKYWSVSEEALQRGDQSESFLRKPFQKLSLPSSFLTKLFPHSVWVPENLFLIRFSKGVPFRFRSEGWVLEGP